MNSDFTYRWALTALTLAAFAIGTSEFVIMGLLVDIANELQVSVAKSGILVSAYAMGVVIGGPLIAVITEKFPRKITLMGLVTVFVLGNIFCALAPNFHSLLAARVLTASCHGTYFGIATVTAVNMADKDHRAQAVAWVFLGTTLANMLGVPLGTAEGFQFGWRSTFWTVAVIGSGAIGALWLFLPPNIKESAGDALAEFNALKKVKVQIPLLLSALLNGGFFVVYTYISALLLQVTHLSEHGVTVVLLILGAGLPMGTLLGGKLGDKALLPSLLVLFPVLMLLSFILHWAIGFAVSGVIVLFLWSTLVFTVAPILQLMVVNNAAEAPNLASTFNQSAFNLGNAIGATLGSFLLSRHLNLDELPLAAIIFPLLALLLTLYYRHFQKEA